MIGQLEIKNFKSIRALKLDCKRINVFIGEPNTGKSNILESLGLLSFGYYGYPEQDARKFVRFARTNNLFYDELLDDSIAVNWDESSMVLRFENGSFRGECQTGDSGNGTFHGDFANLNASPRGDALATFKFYKFQVLEEFTRQESSHLLPPGGANLVSLMLSRKDLRSTANDLFSPSGLRLGIRPHEHKIEVIKHLEDVIISYPYSLASDTMQRLVFHMAAILTNKDAVIVFEEPEAHTFPYYTKYLAEAIALDEAENQYFMSTHNPYFLMPLMEKTPKEELGIFVTYYEDYQTRVKPLGEAQLQELTEIDVFSNIERFLE